MIRVIRWRRITKFLSKLALKTFVLFAAVGRRFRIELIRSLKILRKGLAGEGVETKEMLGTYFLYSQGQASQEEMEKANAQFRDLLKAMGLSIFLVLPFAPISIPLVVKLGRRFGIEILPTAFQEEFDLKIKKDPENPSAKKDD